LHVGEFAAPGVPVATIVNFDTLLVRAGVPESQVRWATPGSKVEVRFPALGVAREGAVRRLGVQADRKSRTFPVVIEVENKDHAVLPGMRAEVTMKTEQRPGALMIPREAIIEGLKERYVFIVEGDIASRRSVGIGEGRGRVVEALSGLKAGDEIIVIGQRDLSDKDKVKVLKQGQCCDASWVEEAQQP
jgi:HlyD family secretion protein